MAPARDETHKMLKASGVWGEKPSTAGLSWGSPGPACWSARTGPDRPHLAPSRGPRRADHSL